MIEYLCYLEYKILTKYRNESCVKSSSEEQRFGAVDCKGVLKMFSYVKLMEIFDFLKVCAYIDVKNYKIKIRKLNEKSLPLYNGHNE